MYMILYYIYIILYIHCIYHISPNPIIKLRASRGRLDSTVVKLCQATGLWIGSIAPLNGHHLGRGVPGAMGGFAWENPWGKSIVFDEPEANSM